MRRPPRTIPGRRGPGLRIALDRLEAELRDDGALEDVTTRTVVTKARPGRARIVAQARGVVSGATVVAALARRAGLSARVAVADGRRVVPGRTVLRLAGDVRVILGVERTLLNVLMHLSGVATATAEVVDRVRAAGGGVEVYATRKTLPGLRDLEKAAVVDGGGRSHRRDLADGYLLKTTHTTFLPLAEAVVRLRRAAGPHATVEAEVRDLPEARAAIAAGADALLLDNAGPGAARRFVAALRREGLRDGVWIELSGGIHAGNVARYARTGADAVSLGALTHSARAVPFHLVMDARPPPAAR